ncbi:S8 family peptidase [Echinicola jeungdonensis]|uniref:S8 family peptidase n=1 Tax=Echinicola jeungdonensis TaxID=709343 RepID=A0ABV5J333_9BACT|nr:S8 family peptidase [Echinicola jeungdonensis]MDN3670580.1 S8 family peptidase [Echinicola jeungdonensis]
MLYRGKQKIERQYALLFILCIFLFVSCQEEQEIVQGEDRIEFQAYQNGAVVPGRYIVVLENNQLHYKKSGDYLENQAALRKEVGSLLASFRMDPSQLDRVYSSTIEGFSVLLSEDQKKILESDSRVKLIEPDRVVALGPPPGKGPDKNDPDNGDGGSSEIVPYGVTRVGGPVNYSGNNKAYIIDTGIDLNHRDLNVEGSLGFNAFTNGRDSKDLNDNNGHGTHVAGTIAAKENGFGVVGVAAGAVVVPIKVLDQNGSGYYSGVIAGVDFVGANGNPGDVANMSLGGPPSYALDNAVLTAANQGIYFSIAAGNSAKDANDYSPARVEGNGIYTVSAMDSNDNFAYFSNFANPPIDWCAPGVSILSTWNDGGHHTISGTSMAAPHVAGVRLLGAISQDGQVNNDPDGNADPVASH